MSRFKGGCKDSLAGFKVQTAEPTVPYGLLKAARKSGQLNLSGRGLKEGNFIHNQLDSLPVEMCTLKNLRSLTLQQNLLENLPEDLGQLANLTELDASSNQLKSLPSSFGCLVSLQKVNLCHNQLSGLPDSLARLTSKSCRSNSLTESCVTFSGFFELWFNLADVKLLDCSDNQLTEIPESLSEMLALEQLYLRHNKLRFLPKLPLTVLENNKIKTVPEEITLLSTLTRLDLTNNDITSLPASLSLLPNLNVLLLEGNPLRGIRRDILSLIKWIRDRDNGIAKFLSIPMPNNYWLLQYIYAKYSNVNVFVTSDKQEGSIPEELFDGAADQSIATVNFSKNQLTSVPPRLVEFQSSLSEVNLGFNRLISCSPDICKLLQLTHIDLRNNQLSDLPSEMQNLTKLRSIILVYNRFKSFPHVLYETLSLETILLANNQVCEVDPSRLMKLTHLSTLDLANNDLLNIPPELGLCTSLRCLSLEGNPFRTPRAAIVAKGTDALMEYLRSRIPT
uniref:Leucine rich repeat containing 40 n=1 Tax=Neolamprologus brichardi TaxID=32507 RepID=A0A3Q4GJ43_NEOBR